MDKNQRIAANRMTEGNLWSAILLFSIPLMLSQLLQVLFNIADIAVVGRFASSEAMGSVGSTATLVSLFTGLMIGMGSGVNVRVAQFLGAKLHRDVEKAVHTAFFLCAAMGVVLFLVCFFFARPMLLLLKTKNELLDGAVLYFRIYAFGMPALSLFNFGNAVLSADGDTRRPLAYLTVAGVLNVVLNLAFVLGLGMAEDGVALASVLSQYVSAVLVLVHLFREKGECGLSWRKMKPDMEKARGILVLGLPAGLQNAVFAVANLFIQASVNSFDYIMVEGNSAAANSDTVVYNVMAAFYTACTSFMGQNFGAGKRSRVMKSYLISLFYSFSVAALLGAGLIVFGKEFLFLFTTKEVVAEAGMQRLRIMALSYAVSAFMDCTIAASRGIGKSLMPTVIVILGSCVFRVIWIYTVFAHFHTIPSLYLLYIFSWTITSVAEIAYFLHSFRRVGIGETAQSQ